MASLYKKPVTLKDPATGEKVKGKSAKWWGQFKDAQGRLKRVPLAVDKGAARAMLNEIVRRVERQKAGLIDPTEEQRKRPLAEHLDQFETYLVNKGSSAKHLTGTLGNPNPSTWYAKSGRDPQTGRLWKPLEITNYRHEFGSLLDLGQEPEFRKLSDDMKDLVLHLIAAGHGRGRPHFPADEVFAPERGEREAEAIAAEVPRRFGRLQRKYGRWGLAYLESLLRAADWAASAEPSEFMTERQEGSP